ncbi:hypothetical protein [Amycolatopsis pithecellobii]|uniref:PPE domain-containing protein n=1 Tax=Amycolatopsis pithecellobii TaxID=664692 RepID=A0A6N7Z5W4_9PSEU|nr:hypothetical protein [Amycolatopsis pithecellobii]MTD57793.1 hypothetical protein [Amycolatopsis pithecellobii]
MTTPNQGLDQYNAGGQYVSPEEALKQQLIAQGYDPNNQGFWDTLNNLVAQAKANAAATQQRTQQSRQLSQDVEVRSGLTPPGGTYHGFEHQQLYDMVQTVNPSQVTGVSSSWTQLANAMATFGQQLNQAAGKSGATWKGDAAESAFNFVSGLGTWSDQSGQAAQLAADQVYSQSSAAETAKNTMPEPIPFSWSDEMKSWASSSPFDLIDNIDKSLQKQKDSQDAHDQAVQVMSAYDNNLYTAASQAPAFNPPPTFDGPGIGSVGHISGGLLGTTSSSYSGPTGGSLGTGATGPSSEAGSLSGSLTGFTPPALNHGIKTGGTTTPGITTAQGFRPGNTNAGSTAGSDLGATGLGAMGGLPLGAMGGLGGVGDAEEYSGKVGRGGGGSFGPGGSGSGSAASSGGAGGQSSARAGGVGAAETAAGGAGRTGAAGRPGAGAGMGHGGKGKGEEDEEHQRPTWLIEPDPDEVFGTSQRTAPPVIGE